MRESLEKFAAAEGPEIRVPLSKKDAFALKVIDAAGKVISGIAKSFVKHPIASTVGVGAVVGGTYLAAKALPGFTMVNEVRKRSLMQDQLGYLQQMSSASNQYGGFSDINPEQNRVMQPAVAPLA
jgi:hypothetical protein